MKAKPSEDAQRDRVGLVLHLRGDPQAERRDRAPEEQVEDDHQGEHRVRDEAVDAPTAGVPRSGGCDSASARCPAGGRRTGRRCRWDRYAWRSRLGRCGKGMAGGVFRTRLRESARWAACADRLASAPRPTPNLRGPRGCTAPPPPGWTSARCVSSSMGAVTVPGDAGWDAARQAWNLAVDQRPAAVAYPDDASPTSSPSSSSPATRGLRVAAQGTGHNAGAARRRSSDTILVKTARACAASRSTPSAASPARRPARCGRRRRARRPSTGWPRWPAPRPTSASSATRSAAAWAGSPASTASPPTA